MIKDEMNRFYKEIIDSEVSPSRQVGWKDSQAQLRRFEQLYKLVEHEGTGELADLGCGLAAFHEFLKGKGKDFSYTGYDLSEDMIEQARLGMKENKGLNLNVIHQTEDMKVHDYVVMSGIFNMKKDIDVKIWQKYVIEQLAIVNQKATKGFAFNILTSYSDEELKKSELFYADPAFFFNYCKRSFAFNVALLHDYNEYDFTILVRK